MSFLDKLTGADKIPDAPDLSHLALASEDIARLNQSLAQSQMDWVKQEQARNADVLQEFLGATGDAGARLTSALDRYTSTFQPLEEQAVREAQDFASPGRMDRAIGSAVADTGAAFEAERQNALRRLESYGVDPSTTRSAALDAGIRVAEAAAKAQAATGARQGVEDTARQLRMQAIELGRGNVAQTMQGTAAVADIARSGLTGSLQTSDLNANLPQTAIPFSQMALQGFNQGANIRLGQSAQAIEAGRARAAAGAKFFETAVGAINPIKSFIPVPGTPGGDHADGGYLHRRSAVEYADGGMARRVAVGGSYAAAGGAIVDPTGVSDGSGIDDRVPINASEGEYIIPADVVRYKGVEFFDKLVDKYHVPADVQRSAAVGQ